MRRLLPLLAFAALALPATANATPPAVAIHASALRGAAPLVVTLTASGDPATYHWDLGDGATADGSTVQHAYEHGGAFAVTVTGTAPDGETAQAQVSLAALAVSLRGPRVVTYGRRALFRGQILPAKTGATVALRQGSRVVARGRTRAGGHFVLRSRLRLRAPFTAVYEDAVSPPAGVLVRPVIHAAFVGSGFVGRPLALSARVVPAGAGALRVHVVRAGTTVLDRTYNGRARVLLDTHSARTVDAELSTTPADGFVAARRSLRQLIRLPSLSMGARGLAVRLLQQRLEELHFALPAVNGGYGYTTYEAVVAVQKLLGLSRTGRVTPHLWMRLQTMATPKPRYPGGTHIEVDKTRQLLFDVIGGELRRIVQVSTGATGNTPVGVFHVYSKLPGFNAESMYFSLFFLRGFAIHGYPDVPPYPASHGCVRTPLWIAPTIYAEHGYGTTIFIYY